MKKVFLYLLLLSSISTIAQTNPDPRVVVKPILTREVSGIAKDSVAEGLPGAHVKLESSKDTLHTITSVDGVFVFPVVRSASFVITVTSLGHKPMIKRFYNNDLSTQIILDPITLSSDNRELQQVVVKGTPSIVYKVDTIEYRASDYKTRENDAVEEILKKMEGFEVGRDGSLTHHGQQITKAKLNGREYAGGDVAQAIQNLPADIVEKIQVVDDYGDMAAKTGIKSGEPQKAINITTLAERSVGTTARLIGQYGTGSRYNTQDFIQRIDGNKQFGLISKIDNTVNGVAPNGTDGGAVGSLSAGVSSLNNALGKSSAPGTSRTIFPSINYRDQWSEKMEVIGSYLYRNSNNETTNNSYGQRYSTLGSSNFTDVNNVINETRTHSFRFETNYDINATNYLQVIPNFNYSNIDITKNARANNLNDYSTGAEHQMFNLKDQSTGNTRIFGISALYVHTFQKPNRTFSLQYNGSLSLIGQNGTKNSRYRYYADNTENLLVADSLSNLSVLRNSHNTVSNFTSSYVEPLTAYSQLEFTGQWKKSFYDNTATSDSILLNGQFKRLPYLDDVYKYSFNETRFSAAYRFKNSTYDLSLGAMAVPSYLVGSKVNNSGNGQGINSSYSYFRVIPVFRTSYSWSSVERVMFNYSGRYVEPQFKQIQPFVDRSDPNNIIIGNPALKPTFVNSLNLSYNRYFANPKVNFSFDLSYTHYIDQVSNNSIQLNETLFNNGKETIKTINQITYQNVNNTNATIGRYNLSKRFAGNKVNIDFNGTVVYGFNTALSNNTNYQNAQWRTNERLGLKINPRDNVEINPYVSYDLNRSFTTLKGATPVVLSTTSLVLDGRWYFGKSAQFNYSATKSFTSGFGGLGNPSPFVINAGFEKAFLNRRMLVLTCNIFDVLHQNNFVQQITTSQGTTNMLSNTLSRYVLVGLKLNLQRWSGTPNRNGKPLKRRGDGSFIYAP